MADYHDSRTIEVNNKLGTAKLANSAGTIALNELGQFGFYLSTGGGKTFFSESSLNYGQADQLASFKGTDGWKSGRAPTEPMVD